jgi:hypothetical protein
MKFQLLEKTSSIKILACTLWLKIEYIFIRFLFMYFGFLRRSVFVKKILSKKIGVRNYNNGQSQEPNNFVTGAVG